VSGQLHAPAALPPGKERAPGTHWIGGCVGNSMTVFLEIAIHVPVNS